MTGGDARCHTHRKQQRAGDNHPRPFFVRTISAIICDMATQLQSRYITIEEYLAIDFGPEVKAELDNGVIRMMAGASLGHDRVQINLIVAIGSALRGSGCRPHGSDVKVRTSDTSIRYPDVSVSCGHEGSADDKSLVIDDPKVVVEILSPSTEAHDWSVKFPEYRAVRSLETIAFVDPERETVAAYQRIGGGWTEIPSTHGLTLAAFGLTIPNEEIFSRD